MSRTALTLRAHDIPVQPNLQQALRERGRQLENFFELKTLDFTWKSDHGEVAIKKSVVFAPDLAGLIQVVQQECRVMLESQNHLGLDGGGGFLKLCLNIITNDRTPTQPPVSKKPVCGNRFRDSGVKKLLIVGILPGVEENYHNVTTLLDTVKFNTTTVPFSLATDVKLANILCGTMQHSSVHPCCWCEISKDYEITQDSVPQKRTLGRIRHYAQLYQQAKHQQRTARPAEDFAKKL